MENFNFNLKILALGFSYILTPFLPLLYLDELASMDRFLLIPFGIVAATPLFLTFYLVQRRMKKLAGDEYQQQLLMRQMLFASTLALCHVAIFGFADGYDGEPSRSSYVSSIWWWYGGWLIAGISNWRKDE